MTWLDFLVSNLYPKILWLPKTEEGAIVGLGKQRDKDNAAPRFFLGHFEDPFFCKSNSFTPEYLYRITNIPSHSIEKPFSPSERTDLPSHGMWMTHVTKALSAIANAQIEKVVLARKTALQMKNAIDPWQLLLHLHRFPGDRETLFCIEYSPKIAFLGSTPEKLFTRNGRFLSTMALAGTIQRGKTKEEDEKLGKELLMSSKDRREVDIVANFMVETLLSLSTEVKKLPLQILKSSRVQHLHYPIQATLKKEITDTMLIEKLHPTPALGGFPKQQALHFISDHELFLRGPYGSPIGWLSENNSDLSIAIRSCKVEHNKVDLFAAAGIVEGSIPTKEWQELEYKITPFLQYFYE